MAETLDPMALARRIAELPPLPQALAEVVGALARDDMSLHGSIRMIERDPALAARTLRLSNSPFFGAPGRVARIDDAVRLLGLRTVASMLAAVALRGAQARMACEGFSVERHWRHALATALAARELAASTGLDEGEAFIAGLLHDVGELVTAAFAPQLAGQALAQARRDDIDITLAERQLLGTTHPDLGALLARHWGLPERIAHAIGTHRWPQPPTDDGRMGLAGLVHAADALAHALDLHAADDEAVPLLDDATWEALGLAPEPLARLLQRTEQGVTALAGA